MLKFLKDWKFIFIITILVIYIGYTITVWNQELQLPSENWSRQVQIENVKIERLFDYKNSNTVYTLPLPNEDIFMTFWYDYNKINYMKVSDKGEIISKNEININAKDIYKLSVIVNEENIVLYTKEYSSLKRYLIDRKSNKLISSNTVVEDINDFLTLGKVLIYNSEDTISLISENDNIQSIENINVKDFKAIEFNGNYYIAVLESKGGYKTLNYLTYDIDNNKLETYKIKDITDDIRDEVEIVLANGNVNLMTFRYDKRYGTLFADTYSFEINDVKNIKKYGINLMNDQYIPYVDKSNIDSNLKFIMPVEITKGGTKDTINLMRFELDNKNELANGKLLTKTNYFSNYPNYFKLGNYSYLVWLDFEGDSKSIFLSSNNADIIEKSQEMGANQRFHIATDTFFSLVFVVLMASISLIIVIVPVGIVLLILQNISKKSIENNYLKTLYIAIATHLVVKVIYVKFKILNMDTITIPLPNILKTNISSFIILGISTLIALYCMNMFVKKDESRKHFLKAYSFFALIDIVLMSFLYFSFASGYLMYGYYLSM